MACLKAVAGATAVQSASREIGRDEYCFGGVPRCVAILSGHVNDRAEVIVLRDADHGFSGGEGELGTLIAEWIG